MTTDKKKALIVVDVQNDFCPGGSLAVANGDEVVAPLNELMKEFLDRGEPVFKTRDWHPPKAKHFAAYGGIWPVGWRTYLMKGRMKRCDGPMRGPDA